jgi:hypothetical protein
MHEVLHYPSLKTVLMVEEILKKSSKMLRREQIKKRLPKKIMHQTLNVVLEYLEGSGRILDTRKGVVWIHNPSNRLDKAIKDGIRL